MCAHSQVSYKPFRVVTTGYLLRGMGGAVTDWTVWYDTSGVELANSCLKTGTTPANYPAAQSFCASQANGTHLVTWRQVCLYIAARVWSSLQSCAAL